MIGAYSPKTNGQPMTHLLQDEEAPRDRWRTLCGRDASEWNTVEGSAEQISASSFTCERCKKTLALDRRTEGN